MACQAGVGAQPASSAKPAHVAPAPASTDQWQGLTPTQKQFLHPLERHWSRLDPQQRRKWLVLTSRAPGMPIDERLRIQDRMTEWATLTPEQRGQARMRYQEARQLSARDRQARWDAYQSLPPEQKQQLAARASFPPEPARRANGTGGRFGLSAGGPAASSSNVPNPALTARPKQIGPTLLQARPGATTTLIGKHATPPAHLQAGMPRIAATPEFVDKATLLPQRGPQAAARQSAGSAGVPNAPALVPAPMVRGEPK